MADDSILSEEEIRRITGSNQPAAQERAFAEMGIRAHRNRLNQVIVAREALIRWQLGERTQKREPVLRVAGGR